MDITDLMYKKQMIKNKLKGYNTERRSIINNDIKDDEQEEERLNLISMNIIELTKLLKVIKLMIKNYNTIEDIIRFREDYY
jgi:hypothetical protein